MHHLASVVGLIPFAQAQSKGTETKHELVGGGIELGMLSEAWALIAGRRTTPTKVRSDGLCQIMCVRHTHIHNACRAHLYAKDSNELCFATWCSLPRPHRAALRQNCHLSAQKR